MKNLRFQMTVAGETRNEAAISYSADLVATDLLDLAAAIQTALEPFRPTNENVATDPV